MLVVNNVDGRGFRGYNEPFSSTPVPLDVGLLSTDEGEKLVRQAQARGASVTVGSAPVSPYVYDLDQTWHNEIPSHMVVQGSSQNLARVDETFDSPAPGSTGGEFRFDWPTYNDWAIGGMMPEPVRGKRTDWVSTGGFNSWSQSAYADGLVFEAGAKTSYRAGSTQSEEWFKPIERPYLNDVYSMPTRKGDHLYIDAPAWGSHDHVGMSQMDAGAEQRQTLYQGTTELGTGTFTNVSGDAPGRRQAAVPTGRHQQARRGVHPVLLQHAHGVGLHLEGDGGRLRRGAAAGADRLRGRHRLGRAGRTARHPVRHRRSAAGGRRRRQGRRGHPGDVLRRRHDVAPGHA